ncbi:hypothetical protein LCGC14_0742250 [marine sediment metagenome]|uniref:DNA-directed DNA polymerase n=1 Tax=marine sediment metagenome TaxID=412755 RepID=A0A0F9QRC9_9ZZZZ
MISRILNVVVSPQRNKLIWYLMGQNGKKYSELTPLPFLDYFFCSSEEISLILKHYPELQLSFNTMENHYFAEYKDRDKKVVKVETRMPNLKNGMRIKLEEEENILICEADVDYVDLVLKDLGLSEFVKIIKEVPHPVKPIDVPADFPPILMAFADFETDDRSSSIRASNYKTFAKPDTCRLLSCSVRDAQTGETWHFVNDDEKQLCEDISAKFDEYHHLEFWNGNSFDKSFDKRFIMNGVPLNWNRWIVTDAMIIHEILNPKERKFVSLDKAGERYVDMRKVPHEESFYELFAENRPLLETYNNKDVEIMHLLENKFSFSGIVRDLSYHPDVGILPQSFRFARKPSIQAIMRTSLNHFGKRIVWKSKSENPISTSYVGAITLDAVAGKHNNVIGIDLASLYNNVIQTWNISPEQLMFKETIGHKTLIEEKEHHTYDRFDHEGIMPRVLRIFEEGRNKYKAMREGKTGEEYKTLDKIQQGLKIVLLAITGGLGARGSTAQKAGMKPTGPKSFYSWHSASDFTAFSRAILLLAIKTAKRLGYKIIYGDTDGFYVVDKNGKVREMSFTELKIIQMIDDLVKTVDDDIEDFLVEWDIPPEKRKIKMEAQGMYDPFVLFDKKKSYFANFIYNAESGKFFFDDIEFYAKGVRMEQTSAPQFIKDFQKSIYTMILQNKDRKEVQQFIDGNRVSFDIGKFDKGLVFERKIRKIKDYKVKSAHIKLAEELVNKGQLQESSTLFYVFAYDSINGIVAKQEGHPISHSGRRYFWDHHVKTWLNEVMEIVYPQQIELILDDWY